MKNILSLILAVGVTSAGMLASLQTASASNLDAKDYVVQAESKTHWITNSSGIRHNKSCRYYKNSKGRTCTKSEGRACKKCGG